MLFCRLKTFYLNKKASLVANSHKYGYTVKAYVLLLGEFMIKRNELLKWLPFIASISLAVITAIIYTFISDEIIVLTYFQIFASALVPLILPVWGKITGKDFPPALGFLLAFHIFLAIDLGNAMNFYDLVPVWDLLLHGFFGFVGCVTAAVFLIRWNGDKMTPWGFMLTAAFFTLGFGAVWEIFEYCCDIIMDTDIQRVQESIAAGKSPLADTMEDLIVTLVGIAIFFVTAFADKLLKGKPSSLLKGQTDRFPEANLTRAKTQDKE